MQIKTIQWDADAWDDCLSWQSRDRRTLKRINQLVKDICRDPFGGIGKPEPLRGSLSGFWSRRIDGEHRLVYAIGEEVVVIVACRNHYGNG